MGRFYICGGDEFMSEQIMLNYCDEHDWRSFFGECPDCIEAHHLEEAGVGNL